MEAKQLKKFLEILQAEGLIPDKRKFGLYLKHVFEGIDLQKGPILDIGGGSGILSFYGAIMGSQDVICLEPGASGSRESWNDKFQVMSEQLGVEGRVRLEPHTLQDLDPESTGFDLLILNHSINHLDEPACMDLHENLASRDSYQAIFQKVYDLANPGASLIVTDCSRHNFFGAFGLQNPFAPTIEWDKHQSPELWASLLIDSGFQNPQISWTSPIRLGQLGRVLLGNKLGAFFVSSHFKLTMSKA